MYFIHIVFDYTTHISIHTSQSEDKYSTNRWGKKKPPGTMNAKIRLMHLQSKGCQRFPGNDQKLGERHGMGPPLQPSERISPTHTLIFNF